MHWLTHPFKDNGFNREDISSTMRKKINIMLLKQVCSVWVTFSVGVSLLYSLIEQVRDIKNISEVAIFFFKFDVGEVSS